MLGRWLRGRRTPNIVDRWFVIVDPTAPDLKDPALLVHVVDLKAKNVPSVARRSVHWTSHPTTIAYFTRDQQKSGVHAISRAAAGDIAELWGAPWPPTH